MAATILTSVQAHGGRVTRYGEFTMVFMHGSSFITTPMEYMQNQNWARARVSSGNAGRDRTTFVDRFETVLGRSGSGIATRGNRSILARIVKAMKSSAVFVEDWAVPRDLEQGMEMKKKVAPVRFAAGTVPPVANEAVPAGVIPPLPASAISLVPVTLIPPVVPT